MDMRGIQVQGVGCQGDQNKTMGANVSHYNEKKGVGANISDYKGKICWGHCH